MRNPRDPKNVKGVTYFLTPLEVSMSKIIIVDPQECGDCRICEVVCSLFHFGECNPDKSRIRVVKRGIVEIPVVCQSCEVLFCAAVCPENAIYREEGSNIVLVDSERCTGCKKCVGVCPYGAIFYDREGKKALICDRCGGEPQCVLWCPRDALHYEAMTEETEIRHRQGAGQLVNLVHASGYRKPARIESF